MKRARWAPVLLLTLAVAGATVASPGAGAAPAGGSPPPVVVSAATAQRIDHFGASGAWWPHDLADFPRGVQVHVADLLFGRRGIALSSYRYNIGGGGVGVTDPVRAPETSLVQPGQYDWSRDRAGLRFLRLARDRGVSVLTGFVNSAPTAWTDNGRSCGGRLTPGTEAAYASYLADVVRHVRAADGVKLSYVSPMNEPDNAFGGCGQEGMSVPVTQRAAVVQALGKELAAHAPWARVIADESSAARFQFLPEVTQWLDAATLPWVAALAHHTYEFPTDAWLTEVAGLRARFGKPLWMTEICCYDGAGPIVGFGAQYDPTMTSALWLADSIWQDLTITGDAAFDWWTALSSVIGCDPATNPTCTTTVNTRGFNDGLLYYDPGFRHDGNYAISTTKRFWVLGNFSRYVHPGAVRHEVTGAAAGLRVLAFSKGRTWTVVVIDDDAAGAPGRDVHIALPGRSGYDAARAIRTSATLDLGAVTRPNARGAKAFVARVPAQSVTTYTFVAHH